MYILSLVVIAVIAAPIKGAYLSAKIHWKHIPEQRQLLMSDVLLSMKGREFDMRSYIDKIFSKFVGLTYVCHRRLYGHDEILDSFQLAQNKRHTYCTHLILDVDSYMHEKHKTLTIQILQGFKIQFNFFKFHFHWYNLTYSGLSISEDSVNSGRKTTYFTGVRRPWTMFIDSDNAVITISSAEYLIYTLDLFYSGCKWNWFAQIGSVHSSIVSHIKNANLLPSLKTTPVDTIQSYHYIQLDHQRILFSFGSLFKSSALVRIYDGPGSRSRRLLKIDYNDSYTSEPIVSTTFYAFVVLKILTFDKVQPLLVSFRPFGRYEYRDCGMRGNIVIESSDWRSNTMCSVHIQPPSGYLQTLMIIVRYVFRGPHIITTGYSAPDCQYGGVYFIPNIYLPICRGVDDIGLRFNRSIEYLLIAWLGGYSDGYFHARLIYDKHCTAYHIDSHSLSYNQTMAIDDVEYCRYYICPAPLSPDHKKCNFKLNLPDRPIGTAHLSSIFTETSEECVPGYGNLPKVGGYYNIFSVLYYNNTHFGKYTRRAISKLFYEKSKLFFQYLVSANVSLPLLCVKGAPFLRLSLKFLIATCHLDLKQHKEIVVNPVLNVVVMSKACEQQWRRVKSSDIVIYHEYYNMNYSGHHIATGYEDNCPVRCKNYTYTLKVYHKFNNRVSEYSANVGDYVFTGMNHQGLRIRINGPARPCRPSVCSVRLNVQEVQTAKGLAYTRHSTTYKFHTIR